MKIIYLYLSIFLIIYQTSVSQENHKIDLNITSIYSSNKIDTIKLEINNRGEDCVCILLDYFFFKDNTDEESDLWIAHNFFSNIVYIERKNHPVIFQGDGEYFIQRSEIPDIALIKPYETNYINLICDSNLKANLEGKEIKFLPMIAYSDYKLLYENINKYNLLNENFNNHFKKELIYNIIPSNIKSYRNKKIFTLTEYEKSINKLIRESFIYKMTLK